MLLELYNGFIDFITVIIQFLHTQTDPTLTLAPKHKKTAATRR